MCVTVLANLTYNVIKDKEDAIRDGVLVNPIFFNIESEIIPYFNAQWENLTSMTRRFFCFIFFFNIILGKIPNFMNFFKMVYLSHLIWK